MLLVIVGFALVALVDLPPIIRAKAWRDLAAFSVLFVLALTMAVLGTAGVDIPSAILAVGKVLEALGITYGSD